MSAVGPFRRPVRAEAPFRRLVRAELLKLRRRRSLVAAAAALIVLPVLLAFAALAVVHASRPERYGPAGGVENLTGALELIAQLGTVAAVLAGVNAGAGDLAAGVFRELVVTGRSRLALFGARAPGGLAFLLPFAAAALAIAATASVALAAPGAAPEPLLLLRFAAWVAVALAFAFLLALGVSALLGSRSTAIGVLLAWQLAVAPLLLQSGKLDPVLPGAALERLEPGAAAAPVSLTTALVAIACWTLVPLAAGAWRTHVRDA